MSMATLPKKHVRTRTRTKIIRFRCTPEVDIRIRDGARLAGMELTEYLIFSATHVGAPPMPRVNPALVRHVAWLGNNVNQIARAVNYRVKLGEKISVVMLIQELRQLRKDIKDLCS